MDNEANMHEISMNIPSCLQPLRYPPYHYEAPLRSLRRSYKPVMSIGGRISLALAMRWIDICVSWYPWANFKS